MKTRTTKLTRSRIAFLCLTAFALPFAVVACGTSSGDAKVEKNEAEKTIPKKKPTTTTEAEPPVTVMNTTPSTDPNDVSPNEDPTFTPFPSDSVIDRGDRQAFQTGLDKLVRKEIESEPISPDQEASVDDYISCIGKAWYDNPEVPNYFIRIIASGEDPSLMEDKDFSKFFSGKELTALQNEDLSRTAMIESSIYGDLERCIELVKPTPRAGETSGDFDMDESNP